MADTIEVQLSAAIADLGGLSGFEDDLAPALASGPLEPVLPDWWRSFSESFLYYPSRTHMPAPLRVFVDFVEGVGSGRGLTGQ